MLQTKEWESQFFNKKIAQLSSLENISESELRRYDIVEFTTDSLSLAKSQRLTQLGFSLWESTIDFSLALSSQQPPPENIVEYNLDKHSDVSELVEGLFHESRFYNPPFDDESGERFYKEWLKNACNQTLDDNCFIAEVNNLSVGFVTLKFDIENRFSRIGIIGLKTGYQRQGLGSQLFTAAVNKSIEKGMSTLFVKTQLSNHKSIQFYLLQHAQINKIDHRFIFQS